MVSSLVLTLSWWRLLSYRANQWTGFYMITASVMKGLIIYFSSLQLDIQEKLYKNFDHWSRDMLNSDFLEKNLGIVSPQFLKCFSCFILLTDQISLSNCLHFLRYWGICVLQLFVFQVMTSFILKRTISFKQSCFSTWPKNQDKDLNILRTKTALKVKQKTFSQF